MKIYLFNTETGVYLGEDFADEASMGRLAGYEVPADATTIVPPRVERGEVPVFNAFEKRWDVCSHPVRSQMKDSLYREDYR